MYFCLFKSFICTIKSHLLTLVNMNQQWKVLLKHLLILVNLIFNLMLISALTNTLLKSKVVSVNII